MLADRLRDMGTETRHMHNAPSSPTEIPPALLGELIGVNATTAARWAALTDGNWASYADDVASTR